MPQFHLRVDIKKPTHYKIERILYTKNDYNTRVRVSDWDIQSQSFPFDVEPFCPGSVNQFLSHYKRLGFGKDEPYLTETHESLQQIYIKKKPINTSVKTQLFMNYFSYRDTNSCDKVYEDDTTHDCVADYLTTMQDSYTMPNTEYPMSRLKFTPEPHLTNRRIKQVEPHLSEFKFFDDNFHERTTRLIKIKSHRSVSYNPCTYQNSDGSVLDLQRPKCYTLDF